MISRDIVAATEQIVQGAGFGNYLPKFFMMVGLSFGSIYRRRIRRRISVAHSRSKEGCGIIICVSGKVFSQSHSFQWEAVIQKIWTLFCRFWFIF